MYSMPVVGPVTDGVREFSGAAGSQQTHDPMDAHVAMLARENWLRDFYDKGVATRHRRSIPRSTPCSIPSEREWNCYGESPPPLKWHTPIYIYIYIYIYTHMYEMLSDSDT